MQLPTNSCHAASIAVSPCNGREYVSCARWECGISPTGKACELCRKGEIVNPKAKAATVGGKPKAKPCLSCAQKRAAGITLASVKAASLPDGAIIRDFPLDGNGQRMPFELTPPAAILGQKAPHPANVSIPTPATPEPIVALAPGQAVPRTAIVIPCRNEGKRTINGRTIGVDRYGRDLLVETVNSIFATSSGFADPDVWLIDDASDGMPTCDPRARVHRNAAQMGVDPARNVGIRRAIDAGAEVIGVLDGHMRVETHNTRQPIMGGIQRLAQLAVETGGIVVARCGHIEIDIPHDHYPLCGANFVPHDKPDVGLSIVWAHFSPPKGLHRITSPLGASYFATAATWLKLGYFIECCKVWGFSEDGLALKAAFLGIPIHVYCDVTLTHYFRHTGPHPYVVDGYQKGANVHRVLSVCFDPETYRDYWLPRLRRIGSGEMHFDDRYIAETQKPDCVAEGVEFRKRRVKSDSEVLRELFGATWKR